MPLGCESDRWESTAGFAIHWWNWERVVLFQHAWKIIILERKWNSLQNTIIYTFIFLITAQLSLPPSLSRPASKLRIVSSFLLQWVGAISLNRRQQTFHSSLKSSSTLIKLVIKHHHWRRRRRCHYFHFYSPWLSLHYYCHCRVSSFLFHYLSKF